MSTLYFTLCSNNYLPFAISLAKSVKGFLPDSKFIIGLVDIPNPQIDYQFNVEVEILPCFDLGYPEFHSMLKGYNVIEFNTAVKPFYFEYLFANHPDLDRIYYLDPDLYFFQSPLMMDLVWGQEEILITPNLIYLPEKTVTGELASLRHGINNLGFIGLQRGIESFKFISWWKERLIHHCKIDKCRGIFVDQKWVDLAPLFFYKIKSVKHPGWNMAWWNLSERNLIKDQEDYFVNSTDIPLIFFHFSGFKPENKIYTERLLNGEFQVKEDSTLFQLHEAYKKVLLGSGYESLSKIKPGLQFYEAPNSAWNKLGRKIKSKSTNLIYRIFRV